MSQGENFRKHIESLPPLREVIAQHNLQPKKSLGQNFLLDQNITDKIVHKAGDLTGAHVFEIGPGPGGLTRSLLKSDADKIIAVEIDERAIGALMDLKNAAGNRLEIVQQDALNFDPSLYQNKPRVIVANLPYNIASPLLVKWLGYVWADKEFFRSMTLMFQKEVADKIVTPVHSKAYGRLSVLCQWLCDVQKVYTLPPSAFSPPPKVSSAIVHFKPKMQDQSGVHFKTLEHVTGLAFGQRRKMIRSSLKPYRDLFDKHGLQGTERAENLTPQQFADLAKDVGQL